MSGPAIGIIELIGQSVVTAPLRRSGSRTTGAGAATQTSLFNLAAKAR